MNSGAQSVDALVTPGTWQRMRLPAPSAVLIAESAAGAAALTTAAAGGPHWAAATAAIATAGVALTRRRGVSLAELPARRHRRRTVPNATTASAAYPGGGEIGIIREGTLLSAAIAVSPTSPHPVSLLQRDDAAVPLSRIAELLRHRDTPAARITVLLRGGSTVSEPATPSDRYRSLLGSMARWSTSDVRIAITLDPTQCDAACLRRGDGIEGQYRATALAARRVADLLAEHGIRTSPIRPQAVASLSTTPPLGARFADAAALAEGDLDDLFSDARMPTSVALRLAPESADTVRMSVWRTDAATEQARETPATLDQHSVVGPASALAAAHLPLAGAGQILGGDTSGRPVATRLHGRGVKSVWAAVADPVALQLVERAVATGARVLVITSRPEMWDPLVSWTAAPQSLWISGWRYPSEPHLQDLTPADYTVTVLDGTATGFAPGTLEPTGAVWRIESVGISPVTEADVVLTQPQPGMLTVRTDGGAATVSLVS